MKALNPLHLLLIISSLLVVLGSMSPRVAAETVDITALVPGCGDGIVEPGEECDASDFDGETCQSQGFTRGGLTCTSSCTIDTSSCALGSSSGGGSGPPPTIPETNVVLTGKAYPLSEVTILKDGQLVTTTVAEPSGNFSTTISGLSTGHYKFTFFAQDKNGLVSSPFKFRTFINSEVTTKIYDIFIAPTIAVDPQSVMKGSRLYVYGQSQKGSEVTVRIDEQDKFTAKVLAEDDGDYQASFDVEAMALGLHLVTSRSSLNRQTSPYSKVAEFQVVTRTATSNPEFPEPLPPPDINGDGRIDLVDFSIVVAWYKKPLSNNFREIERRYFNGDGVIDLTDLSILAYHWTG